MKYHNVVKVGGEGGALALLGRKDRRGGWRFCLESDERTLLAFTDEFSAGELFHQSAEVDTLEAGLRLLDAHPWTLLYPLSVHPEFGGMVWAAVLERGKAMPPNRGLRQWARNAERWYQVCFEAEPEGKPRLRDKRASPKKRK